jgi:biotin carboxylase
VSEHANHNRTRAAVQNDTECNILVLCPTHREHRELPRLRRANTHYFFHDYASANLEDLVGSRFPPKEAIEDPLTELQRILSIFSDTRIHAVISTDDYPGTALAAATAAQLGLPGPDPAISLVSQHKYLARMEQAKHVPEAVPEFALIDTRANAPLPANIAFPAFVKPVKSFFSIGAHRVTALQELQAAKHRWATVGAFFLPFERLLQKYVGAAVGTNRLILETILPGAQVTVEGYVFEGEVSIIGIVDSVFFPDTLAFSCFEYPSSLPLSVQERMGEIARRLIGGIGFNNGMFNIEMAYDQESDRLGVIEINPRMASQFADLYEKVDGTNAYETLLDIGLGHAPTFTRRQGRHELAASFVLRTFTDCFVASLPTDAALRRISSSHPDVRLELHASVGRRLSDEMQDGCSFRYGIISLGGKDRAELLQKFEECRRCLDITLLPVWSEPPEMGRLTAPGGRVRRTQEEQN